MTGYFNPVDSYAQVVGLRDAGAQVQFSGDTKDCRIHAVSLHGTILSAGILSQLLELENVRHLDLSLTNLDDSMLLKLLNLLTLDEINVRHSKVTVEGIRAFGVWRSDCRIVQ